MLNDINIGDKLLCKRNMSNNSKHKKFFFLRGETYDVKRVYDNYKKTFVIVEVINKRGYPTHFKLSDNPQPNPQIFNIINYLRLERYFYTKKELRKIKLNKLKAIQ